MAGGADGPPVEVITPRLLREVFRIDADVVSHPRTGGPVVLPVASVAATVRDAVDTRPGALGKGSLTA